MFVCVRERERKTQRERVVTSMRKEGEWRILQMGSPKRSVKSAILPPEDEPASHLLSSSSTAAVSLSGSNSLIVTIVLKYLSPPSIAIDTDQSPYKRKRELPRDKHIENELKNEVAYKKIYAYI